MSGSLLAARHSGRFRRAVRSIARIHHESMALGPHSLCSLQLYRSTRLKALAFSRRVTQGSQPMKKSLAVFVSAVAFVMGMLAPHKASAQGVNIYVAPGYSHYGYGYPRYGYGYGYRPYYNYG